MAESPKYSLPLGDDEAAAVLARLASLRQHQRDGHRSPHKPLLVLLALPASAQAATPGIVLNSYDAASVDRALGTGAGEVRMFVSWKVPKYGRGSRAPSAVPRMVNGTNPTYVRPSVKTSGRVPGGYRCATRSGRTGQ